MDGWIKNTGTDNDMNLMKMYLWLVPVFSMFWFYQFFYFSDMHWAKPGWVFCNWLRTLNAKLTNLSLVLETGKFMKRCIRAIVHKQVRRGRDLEHVDATHDPAWSLMNLGVLFSEVCPFLQFAMNWFEWVRWKENWFPSYISCNWQECNRLEKKTCDGIQANCSLTGASPRFSSHHNIVN